MGRINEGDRHSYPRILDQRLYTENRRGLHHGKTGERRPCALETTPYYIGTIIEIVPRGNGRFTGRILLTEDKMGNPLPERREYVFGDNGIDHIQAKNVISWNFGAQTTDTMPEINTPVVCFAAESRHLNQKYGITYFAPFSELEAAQEYMDRRAAKI